MKELNNIFNDFEKYFYSIGPEDSYIYYDLPLIFSYTENNKVYICYTQKADFSHSFLIKETTEQELEQFDNDQLNLKQMLVNKGEVYILDFSNGKKEIFLANCDELTEDELPNETFLHKITVHEDNLTK